MLSSTLKGRSCCHALSLPPTCSSPPSLHVDSAPAELFCLKVISVPQTSSSPSSGLRNNGVGEDTTIISHSTPFTTRTARLKTMVLLDHLGGVVSSSLYPNSRSEGTLGIVSSSSNCWCVEVAADPLSPVAESPGLGMATCTVAVVLRPEGAVEPLSPAVDPVQKWQVLANVADYVTGLCRVGLVMSLDILFAVHMYVCHQPQ